MLTASQIEPEELERQRLLARVNTCIIIILTLSLAVNQTHAW